MANSRSRDALYEHAIASFGAALQRLVRGYESDLEKGRDLLQEIHVALWRSFAGFDGRCSLRTWVYRVAHNTAISIVVRRRGDERRLIAIDDIELPAVGPDAERALDERLARERLRALIQSLTPTDREVMLHRAQHDRAAWRSADGPGVVVRVELLLARS